MEGSLSYNTSYKAEGLHKSIMAAPFRCIQNKTSAIFSFLLAKGSLNNCKFDYVTLTATKKKKENKETKRLKTMKLPCFMDNDALIMCLTCRNSKTVK